MSDFISERTIADFITLLSLLFLGYHAFRALARLLTFQIEALLKFIQKLKSSGWNLKNLVAALANLATKSFDVVAPALVLAGGVTAIGIQFAMLAFVPDLGLTELLSTETISVAIIWRSLEAYIQHVNRARECLGFKANWNVNVNLNFGFKKKKKG